MSENDRIVTVPDEALDSIVGGTLSDYGRATVVEVTEHLKKHGYTCKSAIDWWRYETQGYRFSDEDWKEIEDVIKSVFGE